MQRLGELNNKVIVEQKTAPENKHVIWKDPVEGKFKEFKESGWAESKEIAIPGGGGGETIDFFKFVRTAIYPLPDKVAFVPDVDNIKIYDIDDPEIFDLTFIHPIYSGNIPDSGNIIWGFSVGKTGDNRYYFEPSFCDIAGAIKTDISGTDLFIFDYV